MIRAASLRPAEGDHRAFVIEEAEGLRDESQNALLKTLEEPAAFAHLILVCSEPELLAGTILSRCQTRRVRAARPGRRARGPRGVRAGGRGARAPQRGRPGARPLPDDRRRGVAASGGRVGRPGGACGAAGEGAVARAARCRRGGGRRRGRRGGAAPARGRPGRRGAPWAIGQADQGRHRPGEEDGAPGADPGARPGARPRLLVVPRPRRGRIAAPKTSSSTSIAATSSPPTPRASTPPRRARRSSSCSRRGGACASTSPRSSRSRRFGCASPRRSLPPEQLRAARLC